MAITAAMVKELREMTGAGMMDCKKALTETNGDMDAAVDVLKKSGAAKMEKKQSRIAAEGIARVAVNGNVLFTDVPTSVCNKGYISHRTGSGLINLKGATNTCKAKYRVEFNGNIAVPTGGTAGAISLAIAVEGEPDLSTLAISTPTAVEAFNNVSMATDVWLPCGCCQAISVKNTSTQAISVANANITVNRIG